MVATSPLGKAAQKRLILLVSARVSSRNQSFTRSMNSSRTSRLGRASFICLPGNRPLEVR